ncbi:MAG: hypothetical protein WA877_00945, partial [Legionella sp.]
DCEWDNLYQESGNNYDKIRLVWRQLIGFEMRRLPGIDRCVMAEGIFYVVNQCQDIARSYKFKYSVGDFPVVASNNSLDGLGVDFAVDMLGVTPGLRNAVVRPTPAHYWESYVKQKLQTCRPYTATSSPSCEQVYIDLI